MKKIRVNLPIVLEVPDERAEEILNGDISSLLMPIYAPDKTDDDLNVGRWWVQGECIVENGMKINVH